MNLIFVSLHQHLKCNNLQTEFKFYKEKTAVHENNTKERGAPVHTHEQNCSNTIYTLFLWGNNSLMEYLSVLHQVHPRLLPSTFTYTMKAL